MCLPSFSGQFGAFLWWLCPKKCEACCFVCARTVACNWQHLLTDIRHYLTFNDAK